MRTLPVFDVQEMPQEVKQTILDSYIGKSNDVYISILAENYIDIETCEFWNWISEDNRNMFTWLINNGLTTEMYYDEILIKYWW